MKVLIIGGGGREHALAWRIAKDAPETRIVACPGNGGIASLAELWPDLDPETQGAELVERARREKIELVIVGPEAPLVAGVADRFRIVGIPVFGPDQKASMLEGSKAFAKDFMTRHRIPTARHLTVQDAARLDEALAAFPGPVVVKASGLAAGKGVVLAANVAEARAAAQGMLSGKSFGAAGRTVVLEERLSGVEVTMLVLVDGERYQIFESAQDYKALGDGNVGPNTGGMGAYSPTRLVTPELRARIVEEVLRPTLRGLSADGLHFTGVLYLGLMLTPAGPMVLEYNVRFGDPETQVLLPRIHGNFLDVLSKVAAGRLDEVSLEWKPEAAVCVVLASRGYPGGYEKGEAISGPLLSRVADPVQVFHAGTKGGDGSFTTNGGRVLAVTGIGANVNEARDLAYERVRAIRWPGAQYRTDIALYGVA